MTSFGIDLPNLYHDQHAELNLNGVYAIHGSMHFVEKALHHALESLEDWKPQTRFLASSSILFSSSSWRETYVTDVGEAAIGVFFGGPNPWMTQEEVGRCLHSQWSGFANILT